MLTTWSIIQLDPWYLEPGSAGLVDGTSMQHRVYSTDRTLATYCKKVGVTVWIPLGYGGSFCLGYGGSFPLTLEHGWWGNEWFFSISGTILVFSMYFETFPQTPFDSTCGIIPLPTGAWVMGDHSPFYRCLNYVGSFPLILGYGWWGNEWLPEDPYDFYGYLWFHMIPIITLGSLWLPMAPRF